MKNKIALIISREYLTRVRKKSFLILTILLPVLLAAVIVLPVLLLMSSEENRKSNVLVVDDTTVFLNAFQNTDNTTYSYRSGNIEALKEEAFSQEKYDCVFHILDVSQGLKANLFYHNSLPPGLQSSLESQMNEVFFNRILQDSLHIDPAQFEKMQELTRANVTNVLVDDKGKEHENASEMNEVMGMICGFLIYFVIIVFASQVLRGVLEEKSNRIVEVLVSSVKPGELLVGKIVGIGLVGITQFLIWVALTFALIFVIQVVGPDLSGSAQPADVAAPTTASLFQQINNYFPISFTQIILCFFFFFVFGYLIYATLYAATGSVVDSESDSQQYTLPVTLPLLLSIIMVPYMSVSPGSSLSFWLSMIPLTSPIAMMVRLPVGVPLWQLLLSMAICVLFLLLCIRVAAKMYRTGILMYGKKSSWKEIIRWVRKA